MGYTLEQFAAACRGILESDPGPDGRQKVCALVQDVLKDKAFTARHLGDDVPERKILYEDPGLGFCILAHVYTGAKESQPHDHGSTWAIYGQADGSTVMSDWEVLQPATAARRARCAAPGAIRSSPAWPTSTTRATCTPRAATGPPGSSASRARTRTGSSASPSRRRERRAHGLALLRPRRSASSSNRGRSAAPRPGSRAG